DDPKPRSGTVVKVDLNLGRYGTGVDRLGFEPRTSCLQSRRSSADLPAPTRAQRRLADETFREDAGLGLRVLMSGVRCPNVDRRAERALRWFIGLSLLLGGLIPLAGAVQFGTLGGPVWVIPLAGVVAAALAFLTAAAEGGPRSPILPASAWIVSVLLGILWARLDSAGHAFLSGYAAIVAFGTGIGILRRQLWAWPVALASVVGFGPIVLVLATQLPTAAVVAGFVLFLVDAVALLAIHRSYFGPR